MDVNPYVCLAMFIRASWGYRRQHGRRYVVSGETDSAIIFPEGGEHSLARGVQVMHADGPVLAKSDLRRFPA